MVSASCGEQLPTSATEASVLATSVTREVAESLNDRGQFVLPFVPQGEIPFDRAKELAAAMWHDAAPFLLLTMERDRKGKVHAYELEPCERGFYAASAYSTVPAEAPNVVQKMLGSHWLIGMCYHGVQEIVVAVSARATDAVVGRGRIHLPEPGVANFLTMGVPMGTQIPTDPEQVANLVATTLHRRVATVPTRKLRRAQETPLEPPPYS